MRTFIAFRPGVAVEANILVQRITAWPIRRAPYRDECRKAR